MLDDLEVSQVRHLVLKEKERELSSSKQSAAPASGFAAV